jgi:hypothetical protein
VWRGKESDFVVLQCDVSGFKCFEKLLDRAVCCPGCITELKNVVSHRVQDCSERSFRPGSNGQDVHPFV